MIGLRATALLRPTNHLAADTSGDWRDQASCRAEDPDLFFPDDSDTTAIDYARSICQACPVRAECADYAITTRQRAGVWGGLSADDVWKAVRRRERYRQKKETQP